MIGEGSCKEAAGNLTHDIQSHNSAVVRRSEVEVLGKARFGREATWGSIMLDLA
jgi:hypothetical protein